MRLQIDILKDDFQTSILLACWPGMGYVASSVAKYLKNHLPAELIASISPNELFQLPGISVKSGLIEPIFIPKSEFYLWQREDKSLLIFIGESQPVLGKEFVLANTILDFAQAHGVKRVFTAAAMPLEISHKDTPGVWAVGSDETVTNMLTQNDIRLMKRGTISGMNGSFLGVAKEKGFEAICLLGEIPFYTVQIENPKTTKAVIEVFTMLTGITVDTSELDEVSQFMEKEVDEYLKIVQEKGEQIPKDKGPETLH
ncbi:MAG: PAC2 family protein [Candidatus Desulfofervidaceae bacterium]|nr:PAC2 family protein [Candidatus Desulfofervidaceae bacterium]